MLKTLSKGVCLTILLSVMCVSGRAQAQQDGVPGQLRSLERAFEVIATERTAVLASAQVLSEWSNENPATAALNRDLHFAVHTFIITALEWSWVTNVFLLSGEMYVSMLPPSLESAEEQAGWKVMLKTADQLAEHLDASLLILATTFQAIETIQLFVPRSLMTEMNAIQGSLQRLRTIPNLLRTSDAGTG